MNENVTKEQIKGIILSTAEEIGVKIKDIILFGSRARKSNIKDSDWDILIVTNETYGIEQKKEIINKVQDKLVELYIPSDIIVKSKKELEYYKDKIGSVVKEALEEGVML